MIVPFRRFSAGPGFSLRICLNAPSSVDIGGAKTLTGLHVNEANKGDAVRYFWQSTASDALPICLGDDLTDEDGLRALSGQGINIYVGEERQSYAEYILRFQRDVTAFLRRLLAEMTSSPG